MKSGLSLPHLIGSISAYPVLLGPVEDPLHLPISVYVHFGPFSDFEQRSHEVRFAL
jgi:hypothetical protein